MILIHKMQRLPESELDIMLAIWEAESQPVSRSYFDERLIHKKWTVNALNSFLSRLEEKGFLHSIRQGKSKLYSSAVTREDYLSCEGKSILEKLYKGSLKNFMLSVTEQKGLEKEEIEELQAYLNELKEGHSNA